MRLLVHDSAAAHPRLARALAGLAARGHDVQPATRAGHAEADVVVGSARPLGPAWLAGTSRARVLMLALDADVRRRWSVFERWLWAASGGYGLVAPQQAGAFLADRGVATHEHERLALWPEAPADAEPVLHADTGMLERACERALARRSAGPGRAGFFVDRDGTLIAERHHLSDPEGVELLPGVAAALRALRAAGHPVIVISNQAGVGRGLFPESRVHEVMARLRQQLRAHGVELDAVRHCPHAPDAGCDCRKPGTRLLVEAAADLQVSLLQSVMVGDKWIDVEAGHAAGAAGVLVRTGHGAVEAAMERPAEARAADRVCADVVAAAEWFREQHDG